MYGNLLDSVEGRLIWEGVGRDSESVGLSFSQGFRRMQMSAPRRTRQASVELAMCKYWHGKVEHDMV